jgi:tetratricopeptide (TPR) repeat protein
MTRRFISSIITILLLCGTGVFAQEKISLLSNYYYTRDAKRHEEIKQEKDPQKLAGLLIEFLKERQINRLIPYMAADYQAAVVVALNNKEWDKAIAMANEMLAVLPTNAVVEKAVEEGDVTVVDNNVEEFMQQVQQARLTMQQIILTAYYSSANWAKAAEFQEQLYAAAPSIQGVQLLADIYLKMQNYDKYLENAQKIMAEFPVTQPAGFDAAFTSVQIYAQKNDIPKVTELYKKLMDAYGDKLPEGLKEADWNLQRVTAYTLLAQEPYNAKDYPKAIELFERVLKADPTNGDAYYYIGMCKWQTEGQDSAVESFARSVVLNKPTAARARQYLEQIHKAKNEDSLDGLDEILAKAKAGLGI